MAFDLSEGLGGGTGSTRTHIGPRLAALAGWFDLCGGI